MPDALADVLRSNRADLKEWTPDQLCDGIAAAMAERDFEAVVGFMLYLALADPGRAQFLYDLMTMERRR